MKFDPLNDGISSVQLLKHMGDDLMVVNAARVSMAKESEWEIVGHDEHIDPDSRVLSCEPRRKLKAKDEKLIRYLARHKHWTPFSHPQVQLRIKMPIFVARQWYKHTVGFTRNEVSRRYVDDTPEFYVPNEWRLRAPNVKQGSSDEVLPGTILFYWHTPRDVMLTCVDMYEAMLGKGVAPEQARMVLPQATYTEFFETGSLAAYARLASLRMDPHAQKETRAYAQAVDAIMSELFPVSWEALMEAAKEQQV
jgi:thymidylate synthase (FAD)